MQHYNRWNIAQEYEKEWWKRRKDHIHFDFYRAYADELKQQLAGLIDLRPSSAILEIGSGAGGIITFLDSDDRNAVDPLEDFYAAVPDFQQQRDKRVIYQTAKAEELPFRDNRFDLVICDNVLDHCDNVNQVFSEISRVLRDLGVLYLRLNIYTRWGKWVRLLVEKLKIDPGHPFTFTRRSLDAFFQKSNFDPIKRTENGFFTTWCKEIKSRQPKELLKALSFSSPNKTLFIVRKMPKESRPCAQGQE